MAGTGGFMAGTGVYLAGVCTSLGKWKVCRVWVGVGACASSQLCTVKDDCAELTCLRSGAQVHTARVCMGLGYWALGG